MGCDIHLYVERQRKDGTWVRIPDSQGPKHPYYNQFDFDNDQNYYNKNVWYVHRDYQLFGFLAGVRDHRINPITKPKGIPIDMSKSTTAEWQSSEYWHTPSYLSAAELLAVKDKLFKLEAALNVSQYKAYLKDNKINVPKSTFYEAPNRAKVISNEEMERIIGLTAFLDGTLYYTKIEWFEPQSSISKHLFDMIIPTMLSIEPNPEKIRIVFWFDN